MHIGLGLRLGDTGLIDSLLDDADVPLLLNPALYDSVQRVVPNRSRLSARTAIAVGNGANACAGPTFGTDKYGQCVTFDQTIAIAYLSCTVPTLSTATAWAIEGTYEGPLAPTAGYAHMYIFGGNAGKLVLHNTGELRVSDGGAWHTSPSTVASLLGVASGDRWEWRIAVDGTALQVDVRLPGGSWVSSLTSTLPSTISPSGSTFHLGVGASTTNGLKSKLRFLRVRDGGVSDPIIADMPVDPSVYDTLADGGAATDAHGVEWTIERPAASTSAATFDTDHFTSDGANDFMRVIGDDTITDFDPAVGLTLLFDVNIPVADAWGRLASSADGSTDDGVQVAMYDAIQRVYGRLDDGSAIAIPGAAADNITFGVRSQVTVAFGDSDHGLYVAGVLEAATTTAVTAETAAGAYRFFQQLSGSNSLAADLYGAAVIRRRVTGDEAADLFEQGLVVGL